MWFSIVLSLLLRTIVIVSFIQVTLTAVRSPRRRAWRRLQHRIGQAHRAYPDLRLLDPDKARGTRRFTVLRPAITDRAVISPEFCRKDRGLALYRHFSPTRLSNFSAAHRHIPLAYPVPISRPSKDSSVAFTWEDNCSVSFRPMTAWVFFPFFFLHLYHCEIAKRVVFFSSRRLTVRNPVSCTSGLKPCSVASVLIRNTFNPFISKFNHYPNTTTNGLSRNFRYFFALLESGGDFNFEVIYLFCSCR